MSPQELLAGDAEQFQLFLISRLPRLLAILCTGMGMSVAGLIMQQLCMNKFVSPTTGATLASARFGILLALLFLPGSTIMGRALFSFIFAVLGTWIFVWFIQRIQFKDTVMVPLVGIMFGNIIGGVTSFLAYRYEMTQALSSWEVGHFSMVLRGRYEIVYLVVPLLVISFIYANHFNIVGMGKDFSRNLGVHYNLVLFGGLTIAAVITASIVSIVGSISYIGLIVPNIVAMFKGDKIRGTLADKMCIIDRHQEVYATANRDEYAHRNGVGKYMLHQALTRHQHQHTHHGGSRDQLAVPVGSHHLPS